MDDAELGRILNQASREEILSKLHELIKSHSPNLISNAHPCYLKSKISNGTFSDEEVSTYISSLPLVHCLDAWKYVGRAFQAINRGDSATACHLAYYAELRATISILSSQGIAVFEDHFTILTSDGHHQHIPMSRGTHQIAWNLLSRLCKDTNFTDFLSRIISVDGHKLNDFLSEFGYTSSSLAEFWSENLSKWGIDLKLAYQEQQRRNLASYHPNWFIRHHYSPYKDVIQFCSEIWNFLDYSNKSFINMDRILFKKTLEELKSSKNWSKEEYIHNLDKVLMEEKVPTNSSLFIYLHSDTISKILEYAGNDKPEFFPNFEICMISRAVLLSRISLGAVKLLLDDSGSSPNGVNNILSEYGIQHGIIDSADNLDTDLTADILDIITKADKWCTETTIVTPNNWNLVSKEGANIFTSFERVPILGLSR